MTGLYPDCGCPPEGIDSYTGVASPGMTNVVCRTADCVDYGTHRRGMLGDRCQWCSVPFVLLAVDPLRGAR